MKVPFLNIKALNDSFQPELGEAINRVTKSGWYVHGTDVEEFEKLFAKFCGNEHCIGVGNGLDALVLILEGLKVQGKLKLGDEILVPANTFIASILAIKKARLIPILCKPDQSTYNLTVANLKEKLSDKTKAIMMAHLYGRISEANELLQFCKTNDLLLIEDAAQAHGAETEDGRRAGNYGLAAGFSFYPGKNLGALGDGGAVTTNDPELAKVIRQLGNYGSAQKYVHKLPGVNSRLDAIQAAALAVKLKRLDTDNEKRRAIAERYIDQIDNTLIQLPELPDNRMSHVWHLFTIEVENREIFQNHMRAKDIQTLIHYPIPPHKQEGLKELAHLRLPLTEKIHKRIVSLPISPVMTNKEIEYVICSCNDFST